MQVKCPKCGATDRWATIERLYGKCGVDLTVEKDGGLGIDGHDFTEIIWESAKSVALLCQGCSGEFAIPKAGHELRPKRTCI